MKEDQLQISLYSRLAATPRYSLWVVDSEQRCSSKFAIFIVPQGRYVLLTGVLSGTYGGSNHHHHLSLNHEGRWGTTDDFTTSFFHFSLFSSALWDLANSRPIHSLMLYSHLFLCLPCLLPPFTVPYKMVLARPDEREA